jgi:hypothetical protein
MPPGRATDVRMRLAEAFARLKSKIRGIAT